MKRIILAFSLLAITGTAAMAQEAKQTPTTASATKGLTALEFNSKVKEFEAMVSRNKPELAQQTFAKLAEMMQQHIIQSNKMLSDVTTDSDKAKLSEASARQNAIYTDTKILSADMMKNKTEIIKKLNEFANTI